NIECRDAVLAYDGTKPAIAAKTGKVRTRWGGKMMIHPVTGQEVPDPSDQVEILEYINPREAVWPEADYIVSNPPFLGNARMREYLGDGYAETLRKVYKDVPDTIDFVMYWWHKAANLTRIDKLQRFGLITTNSICQPRSRIIVERFLNSKQKQLEIFFAIPEHHWIEGDAAVCVSMMGVSATSSISFFRIGKQKQARSLDSNEKEVKVAFFNVKKILADLTHGVDILSAKTLNQNSKICYQGMKLCGEGFVFNFTENLELEPEFIKPFFGGRDLVSGKPERYAIDLFGLDEHDVQEKAPKIYNHILEAIKPMRLASRNINLSKYWWIYERPRPDFRKSIELLRRFIATPRTSKHRFFVFLQSNVIPESEIVVISIDDAYILGLLSSICHQKWAIIAGTNLGGNTPRYNNSLCFSSFPFPDLPEDLKQKIRELGERLDSHRKQVQANHPEITITAMYNCLEKMRSGEPFTDGDREFNNKALITTLKQIHDDLDRLTFQAYGWDDLIPLWQQTQTEPNNTEIKEQLEQSILQRLVDLNVERAQEERNGLIRWLRPDYQAPDQVTTQKVIEGVGVEEKIEETIAPPEQQKFPAKLKDQLATIRDLLRSQGGEWTVPQISAQFKNNSTKQQTAIQNCLDSLEALGIILSHIEAQTKRYFTTD
ncbi:MAG: DNA methyltransferase, partial [Synechocystis sp.]|nr:DNA methyltransferase [Synechocystis sp.]